MKILEKSAKARKSPLHYLLLALALFLTAACAFFFYLAIVHPDSIYDGENLSDRPVPQLASLILSVTFLTFSVVALFIAGRKITQDYETGSYIDLHLRHFVYWDAPSPAPRKMIELHTIVSINAIHGLEGEDFLEFLDSHGNEQKVSAQHLPDGISKWTQKLVADFPDIAVAEKQER